MRFGGTLFKQRFRLRGARICRVVAVPVFAQYRRHRRARIRRVVTGPANVPSGAAS